jgi:hypothetical protein
MRRLVLPLALVLAVALAGCTSSNGTSASKKFTGASADVSKAVGDLQSAGQRKDATKLCTELLARELVSKLDSSGTNCKDELKKALADADEFKLSVRDVEVNGNEATATVRQGDDGPTRAVRFVKEDNRWKAAEFSTG